MSLWFTTPCTGTYDVNRSNSAVDWTSINRCIMSRVMGRTASSGNAAHNRDMPCIWQWQLMANWRFYFHTFMKKIHPLTAALRRLLASRPIAPLPSLPSWLPFRRNYDIAGNEWTRVVLGGQLSSELCVAERIHHISDCMVQPSN